MSSRTSVTLAAALGMWLLQAGVGTAALADSPAEGDTCALTKPAKAFAKPNAPAKTKLAKGKKVVVGPTVDNLVQVTLGKKKLYVEPEALAKLCKIVKHGSGAAAQALPPEGSPTAAPPGAEHPAGIGTPPPSTASVPVEPATGAAPPPRATASGFGETSKVKVAVMDLTATASLPQDLVLSLSGVVAESLDQTGAFKAISSQDIMKILSYEAQKQRLGCDDMSCIAEIGGALGADYLVTGSLTQSGSKVVVQMQLANIQASRVDNRVSRDFEGDPAGLFDEVRTATKILVREILAKKSGSLALNVSEEGATIKIDSSAVGVSPMPAFKLPGGVHNLTVEKEGFVTYKADVTIDEGQTLAHTAHMLPSEDFMRKYQGHAGFVRGLSWVGLAAGIVGLGGGGALWYMGGEQAKSLNKKVAAYNADVRRTTTARESLDKQERTIAIMDMGAIGGAALGVAGIITFIALRASGDDPDRYKNASTHLTVGDNADPAPVAPRVSLAIGPASLGLVGEF